MNYIVKAPPSSVRGSITLEGSKSISNRLLILRALSTKFFAINNLSPGDDTEAMQRLLASDHTTYDVGAAGTTMRFLTSYLALQKGEHILTGSERMKNRPIGILVDALRGLGASIEYLEKEGYPPLRITGKKLHGKKVTMRSDVSSQFISSLMMIAPVLENGLELELKGKIASLPYLMMTLKLMASMGAEYTVHDNVFTIQPGTYHSGDLTVEGDWSAASYYFSICALSPLSEIKINGLFEKSLQGDSVLPAIYDILGVKSSFENGSLILKQQSPTTDNFNFDFSDCPDLAQTVVVTCAGLGIPGTFSGLESLQIKETNRTAALAAELKKFGVEFKEESSGKWVLNGKTKTDGTIHIETYEDHRMAMCFTPLCLLHEAVQIQEAAVVKKSYPSFWEDLSSLGFSISSAG